MHLNSGIKGIIHGFALRRKQSRTRCANSIAHQKEVSADHRRHTGRPLGHAIEAHINTKLEPDMTLKDILKITEDIKKSTSDEFKINQVVVIPVSKR